MNKGGRGVEVDARLPKSNARKHKDSVGGPTFCRSHGPISGRRLAGTPCLAAAAATRHVSPHTRRRPVVGTENFNQADVLLVKCLLRRCPPVKVGCGRIRTACGCMWVHVCECGRACERVCLRERAHTRANPAHG